MLHTRLPMCLLITAAAPVALADPPGETLVEQVKQAYKDTRQYQAVTQFQATQKSGRITQTQTMDIPVAFDREAGHLLIDKPELLVVSTDQLRMKSDQIPGRHVEAPPLSPVSFDAVMASAPILTQPPLVDLAFLVADDPVAALTGGLGATTALPADTADPEKRPRVEIKSDFATFVLTVDPQTKLIEHARMTMNPGHFGGNAGDTTYFDYTFDIQKHNETLPADAFAFSAPGSTAAGSLQEMINPGMAPGGMGERHALLGQDAPEIELTALDGQKFKLSEAKERVIVLDFWATWCPPCREGLPKIQETATWAGENNKDAAVYAVNVQETDEEARQYWEQAGFTMPTLLDRDGRVAQAYQVAGIPQTVIIADGKVQQVHIGFSPDIADTLKRQIDEILATEKAAPAAEAEVEAAPAAME